MDINVLSLMYRRKDEGRCRLSLARLARLGAEPCWCGRVGLPADIGQEQRWLQVWRKWPPSV